MKPNINTRRKTTQKNKTKKNKKKTDNQSSMNNKRRESASVNEMLSNVFETMHGQIDVTNAIPPKIDRGTSISEETYQTQLDNEEIARISEYVIQEINSIAPFCFFIFFLFFFTFFFLFVCGCTLFQMSNAIIF